MERPADVAPRIARNSLYNLAGLAIPLLVALVTLPWMARSLGPARFGLLGLAWAALEYLAIFDIGLGRATTKYVAESLSLRDDRAGRIASISCFALFSLGLMGAVALFLAAPVLINKVLNVPNNLKMEGMQLFRTAALTLPFVLLMIGQRAVLEGAQRFDISNAIRVPTSIASQLAPAVLAALGYSLPVLMLSVLVVRLVSVMILGVAVKHAVPSTRGYQDGSFSLLKPMLKFGGWVAVSSILSPLLVYYDRFLLGAVSGIAAVGFYVMPFELLYRGLAFPAAITTALFPTLTGLQKNMAEVRRLSAKATLTIAAALGVPCIVVIFFAPEILSIVVGPVYAAHSATAFRVLAAGLLANAVAHVPYTVLQALGKPNVTAGLHLLELAIHLPLAWWLVTNLGITGAAMAWTIRVTFDLILLQWSLQRR